MMKKSLLCGLLLLLAGCAKHPGDIVAAAVPTDPYMAMSCEALVSQKAEKQARLSALSNEQQETANRDAAWMTIVHIPVASMARGDHAKEISELKGQIAAIDQASASRGCGAPTKK